jgi:hypothetical protein
VVDTLTGRDDPRHLDDFSLGGCGDRLVDTRPRTGLCGEPHDSSPGHHRCAPGHSRPRGARPVWPLAVNAAAKLRSLAVCTVTIVPVGDGFRLGCNRDERRDRAPALPPAVHGLSRRTAIFPVDWAGPGTWVGVNDASLAAALLNRSPDSTVPLDTRRRRSRGLIIPYLLECASLADALQRGAAVDPRDFDRFRLAMVQRGTVATLTSDGAELAVEVTDLARPMMLTSSSLGDALVEEPRRRLFERLFAGEERSWVQAQSLFHRHQWRSRRGISVRMERADAKTVSHTFVRVTGSAIELRYRALEAAEFAVVGAV